MEYLDELAEDGKKTGRTVERDIAHSKGILHGTSQIYIYRIKEGNIQILLQRRSPDKDSYPGCLDISCAGHVPSGLTYEENALKELSEELGLSLDMSRLDFIGIFRTTKKALFYGKPFHDEQLSAVYSSELDIEAENISFQKEEISEVLWMDSEKILSRLEEGDGEFCLNKERFYKILSFIKEKARGKTAEILYSDTSLLVCQKPQGIPSQKDESGYKSMTEILEQKEGAKVYVVHRLDRNTGGVMIFAKTKSMAAKLSSIISDKEIFLKEYLAVTEGEAEPEGIYEDFLLKSQNKAYVVKRMRKGVKEAKLSFSTLEVRETKKGIRSLVKIKLETGRFHQIRVQFASRGLPLTGDGKYGGKDNGCTQALWSYHISLKHPDTGEVLDFKSVPPDIYPWNIFYDFSKKF